MRLLPSDGRADRRTSGAAGPSSAAVENACRKDATRRVLADAAVPGPRFAVCADWAEVADAAREIGYPLVLKPVDLCAGMFVRRVDDESELTRAYRALADFPVNARGQRREPVVLLEELLRGRKSASRPCRSPVPHM